MTDIFVNNRSQCSNFIILTFLHNYSFLYIRDLLSNDESMSSLEYMKKECFASGTLSSASLKGTITKIQKSRRKRRVAPKTQEETDSGCNICSNRTVRRILTACLLSFLALLGSVSVNLSSNLDLLRATEAAVTELTSCRTTAILQLIGELQNRRSLCRKYRSNETHQEKCTSPLTSILPVIIRLCTDMEGHRNSQGHPCSEELVEFSQKLREDLTEFLNTTWGVEDNNDMSVFSLTIVRLLDIWGDMEQDISQVKQFSDWKDVLSLRLMVTFLELNHQFSEFPSVGTQVDFHKKWIHALSRLAFAQLLSETLEDCWVENVHLKLNLTNSLKVDPYIFDSTPWQIPAIDAVGTVGILTGSQTGIQALRDTQACLLAGALPALKLRSRAMFSGLSMRISLLTLACLIYPLVLVSFKQTTEWIQNYACSLQERTEDLKRQRQLAEDLLHQMLPKTVAKQLRQQKHVEAESYEKVTIFFSDIVGFTTISASCTPLQVVEMLNNLYMCFDTRIDSYDVYKVETIGDAYMVVSGLPERNGDKHADEIAKMSLDLVAAVRQVAIPHMPNKRLQLRAGIHTGPCVAGIVGYKMPRYCLFGDTVNTASRMESTSLPQRIHASSAVYLALMKDGAYELQLRGEIEVKGKGKMNTYWLIGHKNYSVQNDSLVCHWNPNLARKKKTLVGSDISMANSCVTVQSLSENATTPVPQGSKAQQGALCVSVSAQVEHCASSFGTLGSMIGGLQGLESPREGKACGGTGGDKPDLLPGSGTIPHM
ncbi:uncharacterized protein LOC118359503 [Oncorhynchus keta]|uniref:uncharacterized protein LOC118359503 n=1 Tax=Oncorhynchus keta TaxID=8018 RepID=UPI0015FB3907|nr:uncharacterized protein LOC118359503 [Oncorhynchus keta]